MRIFEIYKDVIIEKNDEKEKEEKSLEELFKENKSKTFELLYISNGNYMSRCYYCDEERCNNCEIPFNDKTLDNIYKEIEKKKNFSRFDLEFELELINVENICHQSEEVKIDEPNISLYDCLNLFKTPEKLNEENSWYCSDCKEHKEAVK